MNDSKITTILNSLEGIQPAEPKPFLHTRIQAKLQHKPASFWESINGFLTRPVVALAMVVCLIVINAAVLWSTDTAETITDNDEMIVNNTFALSNYNDDLLENNK